MSSSKEFAFVRIRDELHQTPPSLFTVKQMLTQFVAGLCRFVPSRIDAHDQIHAELTVDELTVEDASRVVERLSHWIKQFQAPVHDSAVDSMQHRLSEAPDYRSGFVEFLREYYDHTEMCYKEVCEARQRVARGESAVPPERRPVVEGTNGVPSKMKTGTK